MSGSDLELLEVAAKIVPDSGTYYKFTVMDREKKTAVAKVDELHTRSSWNANSWINK